MGRSFKTASMASQGKILPDQPLAFYDGVTTSVDRKVLQMSSTQTSVKPLTWSSTTSSLQAGEMDSSRSSIQEMNHINASYWFKYKLKLWGDLTECC